MQSKNPHIINASHLSLHIAPENKLYGYNNAYPSFGHYTYKLTPEIQNKPYALGAYSHETTNKYFLERLTYNPDFEFMKNALTQFLEKI